MRKEAGSVVGKARAKVKAIRQENDGSIGESIPVSDVDLALSTQ